MMNRSATPWRDSVVNKPLRNLRGVFADDQVSEIRTPLRLPNVDTAVTQGRKFAAESSPVMFPLLPSWSALSAADGNDSVKSAIRPKRPSQEQALFGQVSSADLTITLARILSLSRGMWRPVTDRYE